MYEAVFVDLNAPLQKIEQINQANLDRIEQEIKIEGSFVATINSKPKEKQLRQNLIENVDNLKMISDANKGSNIYSKRQQQKEELWEEFNGSIMENLNKIKVQDHNDICANKLKGLFKKKPISMRDKSVKKVQEKETKNQVNEDTQTITWKPVLAKEKQQNQQKSLNNKTVKKQNNNNNEIQQTQTTKNKKINKKVSIKENEIQKPQELQQNQQIDEQQQMIDQFVEQQQIEQQQQQQIQQPQIPIELTEQQKQKNQLQQQVKDQIEQEREKLNIEYGKVQTHEEFMKQNLKKTKTENLVKFNPQKPRTYKDRFQGNLLANKRNYTKNGQLKFKYRKKEEKIMEDNEFDLDQPCINVVDDFKDIKSRQQAIEKQNILDAYAKVNGIKTKYVATKYDERESTYMRHLSKGFLFDLDSDKKVFGCSKGSKQEFQPITTDYSRSNLSKILKEQWGFQDFKESQFKAIIKTLHKENSLCLLNTGYGKSLIYQFPTYIMQNLTIVVSPLISLMMDQIQNLPECLPGAVYSSQLNFKEKMQIISYVKSGVLKILYISPETLQSDLVYHFKDFPKINFVAIDEAHCISEWSHNFRTSYLIIEELINKYFDNPTVVLTTATSTNLTTKSICGKSNINQRNIFKSESVVRNNLQLSVSRATDIQKKEELLQFLRYHKSAHSVIIYCKFVSECFNVATFLTNNGIESRAYNAKMENQQKAHTAELFINNKIRVICCTNAFAMGIDKPDIRSVIHLSMPKTIENYVQEIGRAGRDGEDAFCHLFIDDRDYLRERSWVFTDIIDNYQVDMLFEILLKQYEVNTKTNKRNLSENIYMLENQPVTEDLKKISVSDWSKKLDMKKEQIMTVMLQLQSTFKDSKDQMRLQVYPECPERIILKFFKFKEKEVAEKSYIIDILLTISTTKNRETTFDMCEACNLLQTQPIQLISDLKKLRDLGVGYGVKNEVIPFRITFTQEYIQENRFTDNIRVDLQQNRETLIKLLDTYSQTTINKIDLMFLAAKQVSLNNIRRYIELDQDIITLQSINKYFDRYFNIDNNQYLDVFEASDNVESIEDYLPFMEMNENVKTNIYTTTRSLINEQKNLYEKDKATFEGFCHPKIIARILQGIGSFSFTRDDCKAKIGWEQYKWHKYEEVKEIVEDCLNEIKKENRVNVIQDRNSEQVFQSEEIYLSE